MQAVIIAAGESSRFWPLNHHHKSQNRLFGKPLVYWTIKGFLARGVREFVVVCRPGSGMRELLEQENDLGVRIMCVEQTEGLGTGNALSYAKPFIKEPFFVSW
ncbi:MAG: NTP transferase domain-containing protein [Candidatus Wildermuthbacteria bacterium]|nr:NTP transferase domain-containing protein [Candidatus Wildermuthbacteria bacterium]